MRRNMKSYIIGILIPLAVGLLSAYLTRDSMDLYESIVRPALAPPGIVFPIVYKKLNTHRKVIAAGVGTSLSIEILQLLFFDRVTDIDDLILNAAGYLLGYGIYLLVKKAKKKA